MNPFNITHPTAIQTSFYSQALFARFDPTGRLLAAGRHDGSAWIWELETRAAVRILEGHVKALTSVDWSRHSKFILTSSKDWNIIIWDLSSDYHPQRKATVRFDAPVGFAQFHPRNSKIILALLSTGDAYLVDLRKQHKGRYELIEVQDEMDDDNVRPRAAMTVARFDPSGRHIFIGTAAGSLLVFNTRTKTMVARHRIAGAGNMKHLEFSKSARRLVTNSSDRTLRQFYLPPYPPPSSDGTFLEQDIEPTHRFNDPINRTAWFGMSYSPDGEWLAGGAADTANHKVYIWDIINDGQFTTTLDGGREPLVYVHWHPSKSVVASTTNQGNILIWHCPTPERWGAFAGGFEEVDENVVYEEKEDEFDIEDEEEIARRKQKEEEETVDVVTMGETSSLRPTASIDNAWGLEGEADFAWADDDPDEDNAEWKLKIFMEADDDGDF